MLPETFVHKFMWGLTFSSVEHIPEFNVYGLKLHVYYVSKTFYLPNETVRNCLISPALDTGSQNYLTAPALDIGSHFKILWFVSAQC